MSKAARELAATRATRDAAKAAFDTRSGQVRDDVEARGIGGRVVQRLGEEARKGLDQAVEVAGESKLIVAAVVGALLLWFLRHPIFAWIEQLIGQPQDGEEVTDDD